MAVIQRRSRRLVCTVGAGRRALLPLGLATAAAIFLLTASVRPGDGTAMLGPALNRGQNAVWLEQSWVSAPQDAAQYDRLAATLERERVSVVYAHAGVLSPAGALPPGAAPGATALVQALHRREPGVKVIAWIGQEERASGGGPGQTVDLSDPAVRSAIVRSARQAVEAGAFDGVQYDIEPIVDGSAPFLDLLSATRAAIGPGKLLSVAAPMWVPTGWLAGGLRRLAGPRHALWSAAYYAAVARRVDQVAVMAYNTGLVVGGLYELAVRAQTARVVATVGRASSSCAVLIGLPTYHDNGFWFHDGAENLASGIPGVVGGLNDAGDRRAFAGIAVYRYGLTSPEDWRAYEADWLGVAR